MITPKPKYFLCEHLYSKPYGEKGDVKKIQKLDKRKIRQK